MADGRVGGVTYRGEVETGLEIPEDRDGSTELSRLAARRIEYTEGPELALVELGWDAVAGRADARSDLKYLADYFSRHRFVVASGGLECAAGGAPSGPPVRPVSDEASLGIPGIHSPRELDAACAPGAGLSSVFSLLHLGGKRIVLLVPRYHALSGSRLVQTFHEFIFRNHSRAEYDCIFMVADTSAECGVARQIIAARYGACVAVRSHEVPRTRIVYLAATPDDYLRWALDRVRAIAGTQPPGDVLLYVAGRRDAEELIRMHAAGDEGAAGDSGLDIKFLIFDSGRLMAAGADCRGGRRCAILCRDIDTSAAKEALDVRYVVDCGIVSSVRNGRAVSAPVSRDQADARAANNHTVYRMYRRGDLAAPAPRRACSARHILLLLFWGASDAFADGEGTLLLLRLRLVERREDGRYLITREGRAVFELGGDIETAAFLVNSAKRGCLGASIRSPAGGGGDPRELRERLRILCKRHRIGAGAARCSWEESLAATLYYRVAALRGGRHYVFSDRTYLRLRGGGAPELIVVLRAGPRVIEDFVEISYATFRGACGEHYLFEPDLAAPGHSDAGLSSVGGERPLGEQADCGTAGTGRCGIFDDRTPLSADIRLGDMFEQIEEDC